MTKRTKTIILIFSFLAFFILSWLVVLYAFGYYFDLKSFDWIKTGGVLVKAGTSDVKVFINDRLKGKTSFLSASFIEKNLLPGDYSIRMEKEKFLPLSKNIEIKSGEATQLIHVYLTNREEIEDFIIEELNQETELGEGPVRSRVSIELPYFISKKDGLLYKKINEEKAEKISLEPVYIKNFDLKVLDGSIYIASQDKKALGVFLLDSEGKWEQIHQLPTADLVLSPDKKKLAIIGPSEVNILWLKDESEFPYFRKNHKELILRTGEKVDRVYWFKDWHLIYLTLSGEIHFVELDPTGGRNDLVI